MFNLFRRKPRTGEKRSDVIPPWVKLAVLVLILYAVTLNPKRPSDSSSSSTTPQTSVMHSAQETFAQYKETLMPIGVALRVEDVEIGKGLAVICGQEIRLAYKAFQEKKENAIDTATKDKPYRFRIGAGTAMPALEEGVIGMRPGGKRRIFVQNNLAYGSAGHERDDIPKNAMLRFDVEILSVSPDFSTLPASPFRIAEAQLGNGGTFVCGTPAKVMLTVWSVEGKKLYETKEPITFTPGKSEVFMGLGQGVIGLRQGGTRTLIVPPSFQKPIDGSKPAQHFSLPQSQTVIVDVLAVR